MHGVDGTLILALARTVVADNEKKLEFEGVTINEMYVSGSECFYDWDCYTCEESAVMFFLEFSITDFAEYENRNRVIQLLTVLNTLSVKCEGIQ